LRSEAHRRPSNPPPPSPSDRWQLSCNRSGHGRWGTQPRHLNSKIQTFEIQDSDRRNVCTSIYMCIYV
jgi:hypothetical protein